MYHYIHYENLQKNRQVINYNNFASFGHFKHQDFFLSSSKYSVPKHIWSKARASPRRRKTKILCKKLAK